MVLPLLGILAFVILYLAVVYWYITIPIIVNVVWYFFFYNPKDSDKKEDYESRRSQSSSYQNYSKIKPKLTHHDIFLEIFILK